MVTDNINLNSTPKSCIDGLAVNVRLFVFMLMAFVLLLPTMSQADGLFDFQMKLAKKGNAEAEYKVGEMYETGFGVKKDMNEAMTWIKKSASQGHETAKFKLLYWDVEKKGLTGSNKAELEALKAKAKEGNAQAQFYVGKMHAYGIGMKKNSDKAIVWLNKAALVGVLAAERELVTVRESKQLQASAREKARSLADEKKQAELKAKREGEKQARIKAQRKSQEQAKIKAHARAEEMDKQNKAAEQSAQQAKKQAAVLAQAEATARKRQAQKQALLKKRAVDKKKRKTQFESDPCSGKSARFLSTCR